jgi:hypothetical protein
MEIAQPRGALVFVDERQRWWGRVLSVSGYESYDQILNPAKLLLPDSHD